MPVRYQPPSAQALQWVEGVLGRHAQVTSVSRLVGGLTAAVDRLTVRTSRARGFDVVLRRWAADDTWAAGLVDREAAGLALLAAEDLPVPRLLAEDRTGGSAGTPSLLMTAMSGSPLLDPSDLGSYVRQLARMLVGIHHIAPIGLDPTDPHGIDERAHHSWIRDRPLARALTDAAVGWAAGEPPVLVHGDYQQFNVLWQDQRLSGVVDWTYTGSGPREIDVGRCRLALAALFSAEAAEDFLQAYEVEGGRSIDPRGDIRALLAFGPRWVRTVPRQVAGRVPVDGPGMVQRVERVLSAAAGRLA